MTDSKDASFINASELVQWLMRDEPSIEELERQYAIVEERIGMKPESYDEQCI